MKFSCAPISDIPQKIIPLEQGLKPAWPMPPKALFPPQKIIPLEQGLKRVVLVRSAGIVTPQKIIPLEQGLKLL